METTSPRSNEQRQSYAPLPASPTLTNPEMILPDYGGTDPDLEPYDHSTPSLVWQNAHAAVPSGEMQHMFAVTTAGQQRLNSYGPPGPVTPTTPIIYGNGTMLSDIGEVTEVESTPGRPSPSRSRHARNDSGSPSRLASATDGLHPPAAVGIEVVVRKNSKQSLVFSAERRLSIESTSTITIQDQALFADFDDTVSIDDSVFQGDDEESIASSYLEEALTREPSRLGIPNTDRAEHMSNSSTSISRRAEQILANAKKRLTTMEGNLTRARSSLHVTTSLSTSSLGSDASTTSPPLPRASSASYSPQIDGSPLDHLQGHIRISSDIAMRNWLPYKALTQRSQSALGVAGGYRQSLTSSKSIDQIRQDLDDERSVSKMTGVRDGSLETSSENESEPSAQVKEPDRGPVLENFVSTTVCSFGHEQGKDLGAGSLTRSASVVQMRDLKDQMKDLKGKISSLREQARADSLKRRSLQSLRTPSPFTHSQVDQWYAERQSNGNPLDTPVNSVLNRNPWNGEESSDDGEITDYGKRANKLSTEENQSLHSEAERKSLRQPDASHPSASPRGFPTESLVGNEGGENERAKEQENTWKTSHDVSDLLTENGDVEGLPTGFQSIVDVDYESESGESLYLDTLQHSISHEDREDAFDYEHFFLHSAMGTISQQRLAGRGSFSSNDSVETTRASTTDRGMVDDPSTGRSQPRSTSRRNSGSSVSTVETFATAVERRSTRSRGAGDADGLEDGFRDYSEGFVEQSDVVRARSSKLGADKAGRSDHRSARSLYSTATRRDSGSSYSSIIEETGEGRVTTSDPFTGYQFSIVRRPTSRMTTASLHRPSVSSFESSGTTRSFPLINKPKKANSTGVLTPNSSPDQDLQTISDSLLNDTASICEQQRLKSAEGSKPRDSGHIGSIARGKMYDDTAANTSTHNIMQSLLREDQYLVQRLVESLGRCVLGLTEGGGASAESRMYRRRIDGARRVLEGLAPAE